MFRHLGIPTLGAKSSSSKNTSHPSGDDFEAQDTKIWWTNKPWNLLMSRRSWMDVIPICSYMVYITTIQPIVITIISSSTAFIIALFLMVLFCHYVAASHGFHPEKRRCRNHKLVDIDSAKLWRPCPLWPFPRCALWPPWHVVPLWACMPVVKAMGYRWVETGNPAGVKPKGAISNERLNRSQ